MRPVNLIPAEERPGGRRPMRSGPLAYVIVGALAAAVIGVAVLAVTSNQISESKAEIAGLEAEKTAVEARTQELDAYTQFHDMSEQRKTTITSLADSRFDWQRVMHELALVLPGDVSLTNLTGTASPGVSVDGAGSVAMRASVAGPALELSGCAKGQDGVAGFVQALKQIDGVTRIGVQTSSLKGGGSSSGCEGQSLAQFQMVVAFDAAPVPSSEEGEAAPEGEAAVAAASSESGGEE
jgi:Tfp pilus assembly protein PilN